MDKDKQKKVLDIEVTSDGKAILKIAGMKECFADLKALENYARQVYERCAERKEGVFYIKDESDGKIAIVHNKSKNALRLKDADAGKTYAEMIMQRIEPMLSYNDDSKGGKYYLFLRRTMLHKFRSPSLLTDHLLSGGYANGYVAIPPSHPYYAKDYNDVPVEIHGGLTFGNEIEWFADLTDAEKKDVTPINFDSLNEIPSDYYVFGFDTLHFGDTINRYDRAWCIKETEELAKQLKQIEIKSKQ